MSELIIMNEINSKYDKYNVINSKESVLGKCTFLHVLAERKLIFEHLWNFNHYHSCMCLQEMVLAKMCQNSWKQIIRKEKKSFETFINGTYNFLYFAKMQNEPFLIPRRGKRKLRTIT